jgi:hypothetical protein
LTGTKIATNFCEVKRIGSFSYLESAVSPKESIIFDVETKKWSQHQKESILLARRHFLSKKKNRFFLMF